MFYVEAEISVGAPGPHVVLEIPTSNSRKTYVNESKICKNISNYDGF